MAVAQCFVSRACAANSLQVGASNDAVFYGGLAIGAVLVVSPFILACVICLSKYRWEQEQQEWQARRERRLAASTREHPLPTAVAHAVARYEAQRAPPV